MQYITFFILFFGLSFPILDSTSSSGDQTYTVTINFKGIQTTTGLISIGLYKDEASFKKEKPFKVYKISKSKLKGGKLIFRTNLPKGTYGIAALDDTNSNGNMDYNFFGFPLEGFGFSNYFHSGLSSPSFKSFQFTVLQSMSVEVKLKYM